MPRDRACEQCGRAARFECGGCKSVYYCGHACQEKHWTSTTDKHRQFCGKPVRPDTELPQKNRPHRPASGSAAGYRSRRSRRIDLKRQTEILSDALWDDFPGERELLFESNKKINASKLEKFGQGWLVFFKANAFLTLPEKLHLVRTTLWYVHEFKKHPDVMEEFFYQGAPQWDLIFEQLNAEGRVSDEEIALWMQVLTPERKLMFDEMRMRLASESSRIVYIEQHDLATLRAELASDIGALGNELQRPSRLSLLQLLHQRSMSTADFIKWSKRIEPEHLIDNLELEKSGPMDTVEPLAAGTYGEVFAAFDPSTNVQYAVKVFKYDVYSDDSDTTSDSGTPLVVIDDDYKTYYSDAKKEMLGESLLLAMVNPLGEDGATFRNRNIAGFIGIRDEWRAPRNLRGGELVPGEKYPLMVTEFINGYTVLDCEGRDSNWQHFSWIAEQLFAGVVYLHSKGVAHRDIQVKNVMIEMPQKRTDGSIAQIGRVVLLDLGLSCFISAPLDIPDVTRKSCNPRAEHGGVWKFQSPELINFYLDNQLERYPALPSMETQKAGDVWGAAAVLAQYIIDRFVSDFLVTPDLKRIARQRWPDDKYSVELGVKVLAELDNWVEHTTAFAERVMDEITKHWTAVRDTKPHQEWDKYAHALQLANVVVDTFKTPELRHSPTAILGLLQRANDDAARATPPRVWYDGLARPV